MTAHLDLLRRCELFIAGFEDDDTQEGVSELLADIRAAIEPPVITSERNTIIGAPPFPPPPVTDYTVGQEVIVDATPGAISKAVRKGGFGKVEQLCNVDDKGNHWYMVRVAGHTELYTHHEMRPAS